MLIVNNLQLYIIKSKAVDCISSNLNLDLQVNYNQKLRIGMQFCEPMRNFLIFKIKIVRIFISFMMQELQK